MVTQRGIQDEVSPAPGSGRDDGTTVPDTGAERESDMGRQVRERLERGATMVEYSLLVALLALATVGAIRFLSHTASSQQAQNADCIGQRPQPAVCTAKFEVAPSTSTTTGGSGGGAVSTTTTSQITTTTTTTAPPTTTTTAPPTTTTTAPPTTTTPPTTAPATYDGQAGWWGWGRRNLNHNRWRAQAVLIAVDSSGNGSRYVDVVVRWTGSDGSTGTITCNTGRNGICSVSQDLSDNLQYVDFAIETVDGLPLASPPSALRVLQP